MEMAKFISTIDEHKVLEGIGIDQGNDSVSPGVVIGNNEMNVSIRIPIEAIEKAEWKDIEDVLLCKREPAVLQHTTRVVGYFSRIENWNKSKQGEHKDRKKGEYKVEAEHEA